MMVGYKHGRVRIRWIHHSHTTTIKLDAGLPHEILWLMRRIQVTCISSRIRPIYLPVPTG